MSQTIVLKHGPSTMRRDVEISENKITGLEDGLKDKISKLFLNIDGKYYYPVKFDKYSEEVAIEFRDGEFLSDNPETVEIDGIVYAQNVADYWRKKAKDSSILKRSLSEAAESFQEPTTEQIEELFRLIEDAEKEGYDAGLKDGEKGRAGLEQQLKAGREYTGNLEGQLKQKDEELREEKDSYEEKIKAMQDIIDKYKEMAETYEKDNEGSAKERQCYEARLKEYEEAEKDYEAKIQEKESELAQSKEQLKDLEAQISSLTKKLSGLREGSAEDKKRIEEMEEGLREKEAYANSLESQNEGLSKETQRLEERLTALTAEKGELERKYQQEKEGHESELSNANEQIEKFDRAISKLSKLGAKTPIKRRLAKIQRELFNYYEAIKKIDKLYLEFFKQADAPLDVKIEDIRQSLVDKENLVELFKKQKAEIKPEEYAPKEAAQDDYNNLKKAAKYVIVSMHLACEGDPEKTIDKIDRILQSFKIIDPADEGVSEKDIKILWDYYNSISQNFSKTPCTDDSMTIPLFIDEIRPILASSDFSDPHKRVNMRSELSEYYEKYAPKSKR